jgi:hypothetical protein
LFLGSHFDFSLSPSTVKQTPALTQPHLESFSPGVASQIVLSLRLHYEVSASPATVTHYPP